MRGFWDKMRVHKHNLKQEKETVYFVNDMECTKENLAEVVRTLLHEDYELTFTKKVTTWIIDDDTKIDSGSYSFNQDLYCSLINKVISNGECHYQTLINLLIKCLDSAISSIEDFDNNSEKFENDTSTYINFVYSFCIDSNSPYFYHIQHMISEYHCLVYTNVVFNMSSLLLKENRQYIKHHQLDCIPTILFLEPPINKKVINFEDATEFLENLLNIVSSIKKQKKYIPSTIDFTLLTLDKIENMAKQYSEIFERQNNKRTKQLG